MVMEHNKTTENPCDIPGHGERGIPDSEETLSYESFDWFNDVPELTPALVEPEASDPTSGSDSEGTNINTPVAMHHSTWEIRAPHQLIEEL